MLNIKKTSKKRIWGNLLLVLVSLFIGLMLVEAALAIFMPFPDYIIKPEPYVEDSEITYRFKSNAELSQNGEVFYTDSNGFRVFDLESPPQADDQIILFIGDSQTFGWMIRTEETFVFQTEEQLRQLGYDIRTVNASSPGWNLWHYESVYDHARKLYPDIAAIVLYIVTNDWEPRDKHFIEGGYLVDKYKSDAARFIPKSVRLLLSEFHFWRYFTLAWREIRNRQESDPDVVSSYDDKWIDGSEPLVNIFEMAAEEETPVIVLADDRVTEVGLIMGKLDEFSVHALINISNVGGGHLYDGHNDADKHDALTTELVKIISGFESVSLGK